MLGVSFLARLEVGIQGKDSFANVLCLKFIHQLFKSKCIFPKKQQKHCICQFFITTKIPGGTSKEGRKEGRKVYFGS